VPFALLAQVVVGARADTAHADDEDFGTAQRDRLVVGMALVPLEPLEPGLKHSNKSCANALIGAAAINEARRRAPTMTIAASTPLATAVDDDHANSL
jgi:hypothetical protein